ncbi:MAG: alcohol dehydrogenase catalytic domain-containing protein [Acidimicrobiia bacterium]|nr:alcohol dehydrogenase catalytic domain-containing protein [Acidimicrobiia bacterium]
MSLPDTAPGLGKLERGPAGLGLWQQPVRPPAPGEVTIEVIAAGICGTDLHIADDEFPSEPPVTMGHEVTGEVAVVGDEVSDGWLGRRVAVETYYSYCEACEYCRAGYPNLCSQRRSIGSRENGGFTRWLTVPARNLHELPSSVGRHAGALAEPLACVANLLFDPPVISPGDSVLVIGPGTMGVLTAQAAQLAGGRVLLVGLERDRARLELAASLGIVTHILKAGEQPAFDPPDVVCECSGAGPGAVLGFEMLGSRGHYVQVGIFGAPVTVPLDAILYKEATVTSGNASTPASWRRAMRLLGEGIELDPLVTAVVGLDQWEQAFAATRAGEGMKYVLDPREDA